MRIYTEESIENFEFWSGAVNTAEAISEAGKWDELEDILEDLFPEGMSDTELNDLLWFDSETVFEWLDMEHEEEE